MGSEPRPAGPALPTRADGMVPGEARRPEGAVDGAGPAGLRLLQRRQDPARDCTAGLGDPGQCARFGETARHGFVRRSDSLRRGDRPIEQARQFTLATEVNALALTKLDGTAKGGVVIGISDEFKIPVKYIGVGEKMEDLQVFNKYEFVDSLFGEM